MKKYVFIAIIIVLVASLFAVYADKKVESPKDGYKHRDIAINGRSFDAFIADTEYLREKGLSGFSGLKNAEVMFFIFDKPDIYGFWMKDMLFPIDIVWLDKDLKVIHIEENVSPDTYPNSFYPENPANYVLEFQAGTVKDIGLRLKDTASLK